MFLLEQRPLSCEPVKNPFLNINSQAKRATCQFWGIPAFWGDCVRDVNLCTN